jgi:predicted aspartyl protease
MALVNGAVVIANQERLQIVDTGSSMSLVNEETARKMGWQIHDNARLSLMDASDRETAVRHWMCVERMQIGGVTFRDFPMAVAVENGPLRVPFPGELLGLSLFQDCLLTLDFPHNTMRIEPAPAEAPTGGICGRVTNGLMYIPVRFGREQSWAMVDTGDTGLIAVSSELASRLQFVQPPVETGWASSLSSDSYRIRKGRLAGDVTIGGHVFHQPIVQITDGHTSIGTEALTPFLVKISPRHQWMSLEAPDGDQRIIETPPLWSFSLCVDVTGDRCMIADVLPESEAARSGLRAGDVVVKVNDGPWSEAMDTLLVELKADTPAVTLTVDRGELVNLVIRPTLLVP